MKNYLPKTSQKGQAVLVILLVMTVLLTLGLSVVSRSVTDIKISQQSQESARALWVAQAGLEKAVKANSDLLNENLDEVTYTVVRTVLGGGTEYLFPKNLDAQESATVWLVGHDISGQIDDSPDDFNGRLTLLWGEPSDSVPAASQNSPALEATLIYEQGGTFKTKRFVYDPFTSRTPSPNFDTAFSGSFSAGGKVFPFASPEINLSPYGTPYLLRIKLLFNTQPKPMAVTSSINIPEQGGCFVSTATILESGVTRKLQQCEGFQVNPGIFDFILFSGGGIE